MKKTKTPTSGTKNNRRNRKQLVRVERPVHFRQVQPRAIMVNLTYLYQGQLNNVGLFIASKQLRANGVYDVDPAVASTAVVGFTEWMTLYQRFRVYRVKSYGEVINREGFPLLMNTGFASQFESANSIGVDKFQNRLSKTRVLPQAGSGGAVRFNHSASMQEISGDVSVYTSDNWAGTSGANPAAMNYAHASVASQTGNGLVLGAFLRWNLEFQVEFFEPRHMNS